MGIKQRVVAAMSAAGIVTAIAIGGAGPASATNECAMRGQINDSGSYSQVYAHEPSLTCDGGSIKYYAKDTSSSSWGYKYLDWNFLAQGTYVYGTTKYDISSAQGRSWTGSSAGTSYSSSWTSINIWYTWG